MIKSRFSNIDAYHIGMLLAYYELLASVSGVMLGINTYDWPGVELGKTILVESFN